MVPQENVKNTMDGEMNKASSDGIGVYLQEADHNDKGATTGVSGPCVER